VIAMVAAATILSILAVQRYRNYYGGRFDLGNMVQAVYNTAHGHFLQVTTATGKQTSRLGSHVFASKTRSLCSSPPAGGLD